MSDDRLPPEVDKALARFQRACFRFEQADTDTNGIALDAAEAEVVSAIAAYARRGFAGVADQAPDPRFRQLTTEEVERIAAVCHDANRAYCAGLGDTTQVPWQHAPAWQRESAIDGVAKQLEGGGLKLHTMRSPGEESHNRWMSMKLRQGWRYGTVKDPAARVHPCLLPYAELPPEERRKDELFRAICIALDPRRPVEG